MLCIGVRIDLEETSLKSLEELCSVLDSIRAAPNRNLLMGELSVSSLKTNFKGTEFEMCDEKYSGYDTEAFGEVGSRDNCYMLYFNSINLDCSNGKQMDTNMVYSSGHLEFHHGELTRPVEPNEIQIDLFQEICRRINMPYKLSWSLRARGSWANTLVWPSEKIGK